jgi:hypothetical protein
MACGGAAGQAPDFSARAGAIGSVLPLDLLGRSAV